MELSTLDYGFIIVFFSLVLGIGIYVSKKSGKDSSEFFLSGRTMPWWLLGLSMVATTFSTDTPNLVTDIVRTTGVSGQLGLVVLSVDGHAHGLCLCQTLAEV
jgi:solute:Na+ symporter, SSS family